MEKNRGENAISVFSQLYYCSVRQQSYSIGGQVSLIKSSSSSNTFTSQWGLRVGLKKDLTPLLHCCWILHLASRLVDDCISCAVIAVCPLGLRVCSLSLAPLGCAADCSSFLKKWVTLCGLQHDTYFYLYSGQPTRIAWWNLPLTTRRKTRHENTGKDF